MTAPSTPGYRWRRKPWVAVVLCFFLSATVCMFWLNRGKTGLIYLAVLIAIWVGVLAAIQQHIFNIDFLAAINTSSLAVNIAGAFHCYRVAKNFDESSQLKWYATWWGLALIVFTSIILALSFRVFLFEPFSASSNSMSPTINLGDSFYVKLFDIHPQRGDIVVFRVHSPKPVDYVKRIVGIPGDKISFASGVLSINGQPAAQESTEISLSKPMPGGTTRLLRECIETLPEGNKYGIFRDKDEDGSSLENGLYTVPDHHYFVLGDNRDNSVDSRDLNRIGFVEDKDIVGKATILTYHGDTKELDFQTIH